MLELCNVPVAVELGVDAIEVEMKIGSKKVGDRRVWFTFERISPDAEVAAELPFVATSQHPNIFSFHANPAKSPFILLYDTLGRLAVVFVRDTRHKACWERQAIAEEIKGQTVTCFSVRYAFTTAKDRNQFMQLLAQMAEQFSAGQPIDQLTAQEIAAILVRSRLTPVPLPIAKTKAALLAAGASI